MSIFQPGLRAILPPGSARNPHVLCIRFGCCALAVNNLTAPLTPEGWAKSTLG
ncbi:L-asparaginase [Lelliottia amnigena]|nr:L-asparaginase [Lelliottia amnigena]PEG63910.1 L-asparaginase [Lelliottia amnigena]